ncbi:hypothetical protein P4472_13640 [Bacillus subtilis]|nr:hypothetical protein [Bacillus subtilis]MED3693419.1 hypothetical protein [Bacillus subtilis]
MAVKFGFDNYYKIYAGLKKESQKKITNTLLSLTKDLIDEVTIGKASEMEINIIENKYKNSREKIIGNFKKVLREYNLKPVKIDEIVRYLVNQLILKEAVKDEFETTEEFNKRVDDTFNKNFSLVFNKNVEEIYREVKEFILTYNEIKTKIMLYNK